jgi:hypothetical protein
VAKEMQEILTSNKSRSRKVPDRFELRLQDIAAAKEVSDLKKRQLKIINRGRNLSLKVPDYLDRELREISQENMVSISETFRQLALESIDRRNPRIATLYSESLIFALQDALDFDPVRHHNQPPPNLRLDNAKYLEELRELVSELRRLNDILETGGVKKASKVATKIGKHFDKFFENYAATLGKSTAGLTIAGVTALLYNLGVGSELINTIWFRWQTLK